MERCVHRRKQSGLHNVTTIKPKAGVKKQAVLQSIVRPGKRKSGVKQLFYIYGIRTALSPKLIDCQQPSIILITHNCN